jgi:hypothetical protein
VAALAKVQTLRRYDDLSIIDGYASRFGCDPDDVFLTSETGTVLEFTIMWKEQAEFQERFGEIWREINTTPTKK